VLIVLALLVGAGPSLEWGRIAYRQLFDSSLHRRRRIAAASAGEIRGILRESRPS
jgi:hypothetical protein